MSTLQTLQRVEIPGPYRCVSCGTIVEMHKNDDLPECPNEHKAVEWESAAARIENSERAEELRGERRLQEDRAESHSWTENRPTT